MLRQIVFACAQQHNQFALHSTRVFSYDFVDAFSPDKRLGVLIVGFDVMLDGFN